MSFPILICDDSALARKQMARSLPASLGADITFAVHGLDALEQLQTREFKLMFLDLTMPELDGYGTLEEIGKRGIDIKVVVVSGDIQPKAKEKVMSLGAKAFIQKPINKDALKDVLKSLIEPPTQPQTYMPSPVELPVLKRRDIYMEVANVAIGRAADALARHFDVFVHLPLPNVNIFEVSELHMALRDLADNDQVSGVCQGFSGEGIAGEALVLLSDSSVSDINKLMQVPADNEHEELELLMDVSNILVGSFLNGLGEQSEVRFFQSSPVLLGQHIPIDSIIQSTAGAFTKTMTFEVSYNIDGTNIKCDLLFMFVDESLPLLDNKLAYLMEDEL
ncbi:putative Signal receiver domain fused with Chemotaxis protein CheC [Vibrio nigripulchritudo MADA3029]|uniref:Signal receiver domain fused with Chemotaxis protein CheC n=2 Tax=Vibrio nigripulchritudo TaxID=28173 RepID=A0AAV2VU00_9VIBR|nr:MULTISPECIES: response regulator [Vibrio]EGU50914.1 response regulator [Vibrio nigripulchritudo ATCC 27043]KJY76446.1 chemotaxis protein CheC [Vibrio nigripulchritudo]UAB72486.1 response regulator [Vibrio sp. SCSIO 43132]CCN37718.1 putative Signal receiver domain fused with Chemotaxis protein CheC [Vibrio nigripulchritudo AM115]CCN39191.1 putative Signal receiver domain fused with Chemotaxis protein CheC [Vibrio nigripulchritudo FTn2]